MTEQRGIGLAVREARVAKGLSLRSLAAMLGVSPATMSAIENGRTPLTVARLQSIAEVFGVPAVRLLRGQGTTGAPQALQDPAEWRRFDDLELDPILGAAVRLFVRGGFHATSMREVAAEAGLSVAGVYHHYASKQAILRALMDVTMGEIGWRMATAKAEGETGAESFALMVEALALFHAVRGDLAFLGASEMRGLAGRDLDEVVELRNAVQYELDEQVRVCIEAGDFTTADPHTAGRAIATMCTSLPGWFRLEGPLSAEQIAKQYSSYALALMQHH